MSSLAGSFLVAKPSLRDPNFHRTVVLILQHSEDGAFGVVINRQANAKGLPFPLFVGGPCKFEGLLMLHGHAEWLEEDEKKTGQVCPGVFLGNAECVNRVTDLPVEHDYRFRIFTGYSGWGPEQLEGELAQGAWAVLPASNDHVFDTPVDEIWQQLVPPALPQPSLN